MIDLQLGVDTMDQTVLAFDSHTILPLAKHIPNYIMLDIRDLIYAKQCSSYGK